MCQKPGGKCDGTMIIKRWSHLRNCVALGTFPLARPPFPQQALGFVRSDKVSDCFHTRSMASKSGDIRDILIFPLLDLGVSSKPLLAFDLLELLLNLSSFSRKPSKSSVLSLSFSSQRYLILDGILGSLSAFAGRLL